MSVKYPSDMEVFYPTKLNWLQRLIMKAKGRVSIGLYTKPGWSGPLEFYAFRCKTHGLVANYLQGPDEDLLCSLCNQKTIGEL